MKKIRNLVFIIAVLFSFCLISKAATKDTIIMNASKTEVKEGETFTVALSVDTDNSFNAGRVKVTFDNTKLALVEVTKGSGSSLEITYQDPETKEFTPYISFQSGTNNTGIVNLVVLKFKALSTFAVDSTVTITVGEAEIGNATKSFDLTGATETITRIAGKASDEQGESESEDKTSLGYGIYTEDGETIDSKYDKVTPEAASTSSTDKSVTITPKASTKDAMCLVYRSTKANSGFERIGSIVKCSGAYSVVDEDLNPETTYYYRVRILGGKNISDAIKVTTKAKGYVPSGDKKSTDGSESQTPSKSGTISAIDTGVATPIMAISLLSAGFIFIKKATKKNKLIKL